MKFEKISDIFSINDR